MTSHRNDEEDSVALKHKSTTQRKKKRMSKKTGNSRCQSKTSALDTVGKIRNAGIGGENFYPIRKYEEQSRAVLLRSSADSSTSSEDSLCAAEHLIAEIDDINAELENTKSLPSRKYISAESKCVSSHSACEDNACTTAKANSISVANANDRQSKLEVYDTSGGLNLDALEKWASTTNIDIDWPNTEEKVSIASSIFDDSGSTAINNKLNKSDIAVKEIDAFIESISGKTNSPQMHRKTSLEWDKVMDRKNEVTPERSVTTPTSTSSSTTSVTQASTFAHPLSSIRLPPIKGAPAVNEDIFHRQLTDMSLLHIPRYLPKLEYTNNKPAQRCKESAGLPEHAPSSYSATRKAKYIPEYLLPGQVSENNFDGKVNEAANVRIIVLDYTASKNHNKKKSRAQRLCKWFACCRAQADDVDVIEDGTVESVNDSFDIRFDSGTEATNGFPSRIWRRIKKCFGF